VRKQPFVEAARILGVGNIQIVQRHIWPTVLPSLLVRAAMDFSFIIIYVAGLSFLGLGVQPPTSEWGVMVASGRDFLDSAWWISLFPGLAILLVGLSVNLLGEALQDRFAIRDI
jgi:peptide/nickel transport system permease protein